MYTSSDIVYRYDGSFDGLLCCVFESYEQKETPQDIITPEANPPLLFPVKIIHTELAKAKRVLNSIPKKLGQNALVFVQHAFLTSLPQKELWIMRFLRLGYQYGPSIMNMLSHETVYTLHKAVQHLSRESHLFKGFIRFSIFNNILVSEIEPKNFVLPLLIQHFCERYPEERFLIHDSTHGMGLIYQPYQSAIIPIESLELPEFEPEEQAFRELWQVFYNTIAIHGRYNPKCRMSHMPKRYWKNMTEFATVKPPSAKMLPNKNTNCWALLDKS